MPPTSIVDNTSSIQETSRSAQLSDAQFNGYSHVTWNVSNAKQVASYFCSRFGFVEIAYRGLETGSRDVCSHVVRKNDITMVFTCALRATASLSENFAIVSEIHRHVSTHGDAVRDVAFAVDNVAGVFERAVAHGAHPVQWPHTVSDKFGKITLATVAAHGDTTHTLIDRSGYAPGRFMPGFEAPRKMQPYLDTVLGDSGIDSIDHCVGNQGWHEMEEVCRFYEEALGFHRFWSVDDKQISTEFSALKSTVMASPNNVIKMPINEPAPGRKKSQIEEFVEFYNGSGIQHIALRTSNIIETVTNLRQRGVEFIEAPPTYYQKLAERLSTSPVNVKEDLRTLQDLDILVDFDDQGYLLQLFTKPLVDRPTIFIEIIQRENFDGFGAGNFKSLFEAIEQDQLLRGTL